MKNYYRQHTPERYFRVEHMFTFLCLSTHIYCFMGTGAFPGFGPSSDRAEHADMNQAFACCIVVVHLIRLKMIFMNIVCDRQEARERHKEIMKT